MTTLDPKMADILLRVVGELRRISKDEKPDEAVLDKLAQELAPLACQTNAVRYYGGWRDLPENDDPWGPRTTKLDIVKTIRAYCHISLKEAADIVNTAVPTIPVRLFCPSRDEAVRLLQEIRGLGGNADMATEGEVR